MGYFQALGQEASGAGAFSDTLTGRYAWLEHEEGIWHFLTNLLADPMDSKRRWSSRQHALEELTKEGWIVVGIYPENSSVSRPDGGGSRGYGLMQVGHWKCENLLTAN